MKTNSTSNAIFSKVLTIVVVFVFFISVNKASALPFSSLPSQSSPIKYNFNTAASGIVYSSIDAIATEKNVIVKWVTAAELNNSHFEVERSTDMVAFKTVALVLDGFSAIGTGKSYQFKENAADFKNGKTVYYRLKQFDTEGNISYSITLPVKIAAKGSATVMQISPNPLSENLSVRLNAVEQGLAEVRIVNLNGITMLSKQSTINKGVSAILVEGLNKLTTGIYMAQLIMNGTIIENQKLIKE